MQPDIEASIHILRAFNRWLDEDWGFAYRDRIFAVPFLTLSDVDQAVEELEWCLDHGARVVSIRNGPAFTPDGTQSPADPMFDPFWARVGEAGVVVAPHAGFEDGYTRVYAAVAEEWGRSAQRSAGTGDASAVRRCHRIAHEAPAGARLRRHPRRRPPLRAPPRRARRATSRTAARGWATCSTSCRCCTGRTPACSPRTRSTSSTSNCWVAPFVEDSVPELAHAPPGRADPVRLRLAARRGHRASARLLRERRGVLARRPAPDHGGERARAHPRVAAERRSRRKEKPPSSSRWTISTSIVSGSSGPASTRAGAGRQARRQREAQLVHQPGGDQLRVQTGTALDEHVAGAPRWRASTTRRRGRRRRSPRRRTRRGRRRVRSWRCRSRRW